MIGKAFRHLRVHGPVSTARHALRFLARQGGAARAEDLAATRTQLDAANAAIAQLSASVQTLRTELDARPQPIDLSPALDAFSHVIGGQSDALRWLAEHHHSSSPRPMAVVPGASPLVSINLPVWNRAAQIGDAIRSVLAQTYQHWELLVIDDGSTDGTADAVAPFLADPRITWLPGARAGQARTRNRGLAASRGELMAYIDSDDLWFPSFLEQMSAALASSPATEMAYGAQLMVDQPGQPVRIAHLPFDRDSLARANTISMNAVVHRRGLYDRLGGCDETLARLVDWDLVLRYTADAAPLAVPVLGAVYRFGAWASVSQTESAALASFQIRRKHRRVERRPLRVLMANEFFPQLTETYVTTEIAHMRREGVHFEVWTEHDGSIGYETDVPIHKGTLEDAIARVRPDVIHVHHLYRAIRYAPIVSARGLPMTVRGHGFEFSDERLAELRAAPCIRAVYQFPHLIPPSALADARVRAMTACFDPELYSPGTDVDPKLVVRTGLASATKDLPMFIRLAARFPSHRFVMIPCWSIGYPGYLDELRDLNRSLGSPVEIRENLPHLETAAIIKRAGVYVHTHGLAEPYGMPVSILESMAAGCYVIGRRAEGSVRMLTGVGATYDTEDEAAAALAATESWTMDQWRQVRLAAIDRAFGHYTAMDVLEPLLQEWTAIVNERVLTAP